MRFGPDGFIDEQQAVLKKLDDIANRLEKGITTKKYLLRPMNPNDDRKPCFMAEVWVNENNEERLRSLIEGTKDSEGYGISMKEVKE